MTKEYNQHLDKVLKSHRYTQDGVYDQLKTKRNTVVELIQKEYGSQIYSPFDSGSILKKTAIRSHFDYDIIVPFKYDTFGHPKEMLEAFHKSLQRKNLKIRKQNVSVGLDIGIIPGKYDFDIVPGLEKSKGDYKNSGELILYTHRDAKPRKIITNIKKQVEYFKKSPDVALNMVKLLKIWKYHKKVYIKSYLLELMAIEAMENSPKGLWNQLHTTLEYVRDYIVNGKVTDPGNNRNHVGDSVDRKIKTEIANRIKNLIQDLDKDTMRTLKDNFPI